MILESPWKSQISIDEQRAARLIRSHFPQLEPLQIEALDQGWDNAAFQVNGTWVFRFPRRHVAAGLLETEAAVLPRLAPHLPLKIPIPEFTGKPTEAFPWVFMGYRRIAGQSACEFDLTSQERTRLAVPLAEFLRSLHRVSVTDARAWGVPIDRFQRLDIESRLPQIRARLTQLQQVGILQDTGPWLKLVQDRPTFSESETLVHGDLHACQLLLDSNRLVGIYDWGDIHLGNAAVDLAVGWTLLPPPARETFLRAYGRVSNQQWLMARQRALFVTVMLASYALDTGKTSVLAECRQGLENIRQL